MKFLKNVCCRGKADSVMGPSTARHKATRQMVIDCFTTPTKTPGFCYHSKHHQGQVSSVICVIVMIMGEVWEGICQPQNNPIKEAQLKVIK